MKKKVLVVDIGGTHVKLMISPRETRKFDSGMKFSPKQLASEIKKATPDWKYGAISIGFPSVVKKGRVKKDPKHLAAGWIDWDFRKSLGKPTRVLNDAAMQALGSYHGGRMLFLGLGTGLGSALLWDRTVLSLELGDLPYLDDLSVEDWVGDAGRQKFGDKRWQAEVRRVVSELKRAFIADYVVLGGGNAKLVENWPAGIALGHNRNAFTGGTRLWLTGRDGKPAWNII
jgi:polyphosphate glucokinase